MQLLMTAHNRSASFSCLLVCATLLLLGGEICASAQEPRLSHLAPHLAAEALSHLNAHAPGLPPPALLVPLGNGVDGVLKGINLADEARLIDALAGAGLQQTVLRVGVGRAAGVRMALVKLQAGDAATGRFSVAQMHEDAARALSAAFGSSLALQHVDMWAVVPGGEMIGDEQEHFPVFSVSVARPAFAAAQAGALSADDLISRLEIVRYSRLLLDYAVDRAAVRLPRSGLTDPEMLGVWDQLVQRASGEEERARMRAVSEVTAIFHGAATGREVALTIDDGPHPLITPLMLRVLERAGVRATFFVVGSQCEQFPGLLREIVAAGHELGNHAYSNRRLSELSGEEAWAEVAACDRIVKRITGRQMRYFRPPGGRCSEEGLRAAASLGYAIALWSRNTGDWRKPPPEVIRHNALSGLRPGDIILMHQGEMCSVEALPGIIAGVRAAGLEPVTLAQLGQNGGLVRDTPARVKEIVNGDMLGEE